MVGKLRRNLIIGLVLGIGLYIVMGVYADFNSLLESFRDFDWLLLPVAMSLVVINYVIRFFKWEYLLRQLGIRVPAKPSLVIFFSGLTMSISPAKIGEVMKSFLLKDYADVKISRSAPVVVAERLTDVIGVVILGSIGTVAYGLGEQIMAVTLVLVVVFILIVQSRSISLRLLHLAERLPVVKKVAEHLEDFYESSYSLLKIQRLTPAIILSTLGWFTECVASWLLLKGLGIDVELLMVTFVFVTGTLAGAMAMIPGGLGVAEGSMTGLFINAGVDRTGAVAGTLLIRLVTFWFAIVLGLIALAVYGAVYGRKSLVEEVQV